MSRTHFINANLLDGERPARTGVSVTTEGQRIVAVGDKKVQPSADDTVVDLAGRTLMPGLVQGHFHGSYHNLGAEPGLIGMETPPVYMGYRTLANAQLALRAGYTSVVGAGCSYAIDASLSKAIEDGLVTGPRMVPCSNDMETSADANAFIPWWVDAKREGGFARFGDSPMEFRKLVRNEIDRGAKMIKVFVSGGHVIGIPKSVDIVLCDELEAIVEAAHARNVRVRIHVATKARMMHAIECGVDILDHADELDDEVIEAAAKAGTFVLPSLYLQKYLMDLTKHDPGMLGNAFSQEDRDDFAFMCKQLPKAVKAGVRICVGDDFGAQGLPHGEYAKELAVYVDHAGISPLEVIRWATRNGGQLFGRDDLGTIAPGKLADLVIVDGDPSQDIKILQDMDRIVAVVKDGKLECGGYPSAKQLREVA